MSFTFDEETFLAAIVFALIKLVGYGFLLRWLRRYLPSGRHASPFIVALSRVALGAVVGWLVASTFDVETNLSWYSLLVLLRAVEWALVFWYFYERPSGKTDWARLAVFSFYGTVVSCLLDLPAAFSAIVVPMMAFGFC